MRIRKTEINDIDRVLEIYENGRQYMRQNGNLEQWNNNYPSKEVVDEDISNGWSYVAIDEDTNEIIGVFAYLPGPDITYRKIYEGKWPNDKDYYVIHRIAVAVHRRGVASFIYDFCLNKSEVIRIDTHRDNIPMQNSLKKNGFSYCGIIHLLNGDERLAYQKERCL